MRQISCATYAIKHLGPPVIFQYEDDIFVSISGEAEEGGYQNAIVLYTRGTGRTGRPTKVINPNEKYLSTVIFCAISRPERFPAGVSQLPSKAFSWS
jgi:hypothetical protein